MENVFPTYKFPNMIIIMNHSISWLEIPLKSNQNNKEQTSSYAKKVPRWIDYDSYHTAF